MAGIETLLDDFRTATVPFIRRTTWDTTFHLMIPEGATQMFMSDGSTDERKWAWTPTQADLFADDWEEYTPA